MTATIGLGERLTRLAHSAVGDDLELEEAERRRQAVQWLDTHGFPTRKDEDWRYLPLGSILDQSLALPGVDATQEVSTDALAAVVPDLGGPRLVFVNGRFAPAASRLAGLPEGVTIGALTSGALRGVQADRSTSPPPYPHAFVALNDALGAGGAVIRVGADLTVDSPIQVVYLTHPVDAPVLSNLRLAMVAGPGSNVRLVETFVGLPGVRGLTNAVTTVHCAESAQVDVDRVQDEAPGSHHLSWLDVHQDRESRFSCRSFSLGAQVARHEVRVRLAGKGAETHIEGLFVPCGDQFHDHPILIEHLAPDTRSRQLYQGIVDEGGHGVFNGRIVVSAGAQGTDAEQVNRNLLLSDRAEIDTRPRLEIFTDQVRCTHGATVGRLDDAALFYLRSRGIPLPQARAMLLHAVADEIAGRIPLDALRADIVRRLTRIIDGEGSPW